MVKRESLVLRTFRMLSTFREFALIIVLVVFGFVMSLASPVFLTKENIEAILLALSVEATIAVGMVNLLISGGLDLSVGSTLAFTGVVTGLALNAGVPVVISILLGLLAALGVGLVNGLLVAKMKINPFIVTLGTNMAVRGLLLVIAQGRAVLNLPPEFTIIGQGRLFGIQYPIYVMLALVLIGDFLLRNTRFFRQNYYIGSNEKAARLSGINVDWVKVINYCIVALLAGVAGLMITARFGSASVTVGSGTELRVITATIIGGASLSGGEGSVLGAFLGALFMGVLANALNLLGVDVYWQNLITGLILIGAVVIDVVNERRKNRTQVKG
ncbi:MAG: ABC transporter permease [Thermanaerothrix sp.]|uniref:ABC transporter permease n=1 Tax=Thermanaerothrix solaris TaxID=3058434 RepID=A0ABU3NJL5_9CHLR|nr:ABC transporter permease [Thermanaerothrix sp. 4228-RoL]MDT8897043.1 ABC transporter permease [Thermanaerothrix sp. 4228-RoL]